MKLLLALLLIPSIAFAQYIPEALRSYQDGMTAALAAQNAARTAPNPDAAFQAQQEIYRDHANNEAALERQQEFIKDLSNPVTAPNPYLYNPYLNNPYLPRR